MKHIYTTDKFSYDLLKRLLDKYYDSKLSKGGSQLNLKIRLTTKDKELASYMGRDAFKYIDDNNAKLSELEKQNYIIINKDRDGYLISVELNQTAIEDVKIAINYPDRDKMLEQIIKTFNSFENVGFVSNFAEAEIQYIKKEYKWHKSSYKDEKELVSLLKVLNAMVMQTEEIMERDFSANVLGDSKAFAGLRKKVITIAKEYDESLLLNEDDEDNEAYILSNYNIVKNSTYALIKGDLNFRLNEQVIQLRMLGFEYSLSDAMIKQMELLQSDFKKLITVENLTSFYQLSETDAVIVFLSGFHNHTKQMLLKKIYEKYNVTECYHFGDIDVGGFMIYNNLVSSTNIPFKPYRMGVEELKSCPHPKQLTNNDRQRLLKLRNNNDYTIFYDTIDYMLEHNIKLEQEMIDN
jgi:hypothetical protein